MFHRSLDQTLSSLWPFFRPASQPRYGQLRCLRNQALHLQGTRQKPCEVTLALTRIVRSRVGSLEERTF